MNYASVGRLTRVAEDCEISQARQVDIKLSAILMRQRVSQMSNEVEIRKLEPDLILMGSVGAEHQIWWTDASGR